MSSKQLTAKVRLDTSQTERKLKSLEKKINRVNNLVNKQSVATRGLAVGFDNAARSANKLNKNVKQSASSVGFLTKKVKMLAKAYLGVMGARAAINTSDLITSAENKLNNIPGGNQKQTQRTMDNTYAAAQRSRGDYGAMLSNVAKTMTLAGDAFQGNVDNAIKFQEIMSKAYTIGGASAAEQSSSMYQLVQALGSGVLQGDELRSVREGAAYAYKEIEKFAQGIYKTDESLKELASEGKITSDIVVAAIMSSEDKINEAFENTDRTFAQVGTSIKNTAIKAFEPVLQMLNDALNSSAGQAVINGIGNSIVIVANVILYLFNLIKGVYQFVVDNWPLISKIIMTIGTIIAVALLPRLIAQIKFLVWAIFYYGYLAVAAVGSAVATAAAWLAANWPLALMLILLAAIVIAIIWVADSFVDACGIICGVINVLNGVIYNALAFIVNMITGVFNFIIVGCQQIGIAFNNAWQSAKASFWEWVSECLNGTGMIAKAVSAIASLFGLDGASIDAKVSAAKSKMLENKTQEEFLAGFSAVEYKSLKGFYDRGYDFGAQGGEWITDKISGVGDWLKQKLNLGSLPDAFNPDYNVGGIGNGYDPSDALKGIKGDTGNIADGMELTQEDMEYLRRVADMEWKKEYTTASITVDMSNYNTINGENDLDGIVTKLADKLYEEMDYMANGVYAY